MQTYAATDARKWDGIQKDEVLLDIENDRVVEKTIQTITIIENNRMFYQLFLLQHIEKQKMNYKSQAKRYQVHVSCYFLDSTTKIWQTFAIRNIFNEYSGQNQSIILRHQPLSHFYFHISTSSLIHIKQRNWETAQKKRKKILISSNHQQKNMFFPV